jgi:hypothetical protein
MPLHLSVITSGGFSGQSSQDTSERRAPSECSILFRQHRRRESPHGVDGDSEG